MGLRGFLERVSGEVARVACEVSGVIASFRERVRGRVGGEIAADPSLQSILLAGLDYTVRGDPYSRGGLARFYRDLVGVGLSLPRLVALRLYDGLPVSYAVRGVSVRAFETRFSRLASTLCSVARRLAGLLGVRVGEVNGDSERVLEDPLWLPQRIEDLLNTLLRYVPPYTVEGFMLLALLRGAPADTLEGAGVDLAEAEGLGARPLDAGVFKLYRAEAGTPVHLYGCLVYTAWKLAELREVQLFYDVERPLEKLAGHAWELAGYETYRKLEPLAAYGRTSQCLDSLEECKAEPPCLPEGYRLVKISASLEEGWIAVGSERLKPEELAETIKPLVLAGAAWLEAEKPGTLRLNYVYTLNPPSPPPQPETQVPQQKHLTTTTQHIPTRVGPPGSPEPPPGEA